MNPTFFVIDDFLASIDIKGGVMGLVPDRTEVIMDAEHHGLGDPQ